MYRPSRERSVEAALAAVAAVAGSLLAAGNTPAFVGAGAAAVVRDTAPGFVAAVVRSLGDLAQPLLVAVTGLLLLGTYAAATVLARQYADGTAPRTAATLALAGGVTLLLTGSPVSALGAGVASAAVVVAATLSLGSDPSEDTSPARRRLLQAGAATLAALAASAVRLGGSGSSGTGSPEPPDPAAQSLLSTAETRSLSLPNADGLVSEGFYTVDIATVAPNLGGDWELTVTGEVPEERSFSLSELRSFEGERRFVTLRCVSDRLNGEKIDTALWDGVPIETVLDAADAPESCCVTLHAADDYFVSFPREALDPGLLAWGMNGRPLPRAHGAPVRTLVPGHWGETNAKWLTEIEIREEPEDGYWEQRGWEGTGEVNTVAKLHSTTVQDGTVRVGGHAYAGTRGVRAVEVSTDGGDSWTEATLSDPLPGATPLDAEEPDPDGEAVDAWRMWEHEYEATDEHEVVVRAVDGDGTVQPEEQGGAYPSGATGWVSETIAV
ncbi:molybdopterin-dependent oxidoreductase [Halolamina sp. CBA1230]|uniref:molybdopterin-dependent oxidoreductase n=1 Tax=Halolamina sp. CBA1230 TaxID=1853690 RepID=UPI0009A18B67|nr:molybdopterin-dependent oxidoreductase [Halolamina sp. CBA1230]QKY20911.1 molybdopterin-dependent oxidoreductase [Halolamina sp. CBA1230]